jgi:tripartite-type tricarboxylate transporter receptor subunit TctC
LLRRKSLLRPHSVSFCAAATCPVLVCKSEVIKTLNDALQEAVSDPAIVKIWDTESFFAYPEQMRTPAAANTLLKSEIERWGQVIRDNDIHVDQ